jgi:hypothetical protein
MKKTIMICDRCHAEYRPAEITGYIYKLIEDDGDFENDVDLCPECTKELEMWFRKTNEPIKTI